MSKEGVSRVLTAGARPVSAASTAAFRIAFGVAMVINTFLYFPQLVQEYYVDTSLNFPYGPFAFVRPLPGAGMDLVYLGMALFGALIALGLFYRWSAAAFFLLTTYVFLLDSTYYQNHEYLISLLSFLLIFLPAHRMWSVDARRRREIASSTVPAWVVWLLRFQIGVPYFFGGIAKLNADWLRGEPLRMWLADRSNIELIGPLFTNEIIVWAMAYGALVLDLAVVWFLLYHRTRVAAYCVTLAFHLLNFRLWGLFIFPWLMIAATLIFFPPDWPLRVRAWLGGRLLPPARVMQPALATLSGRGGTAVRYAPLSPFPTPAAVIEAPAARRMADDAPGPAPTHRTVHRVAPPLAGALVLWVLVQLLVPLRHYVIEGSPSWTEEGHRFAWHMMLRVKQGSVSFVLTDGERTWRVDPAEYLSPKQTALLAGHPERLVRFARHLSNTHGGVEVRAETSVALNGRRPLPIVDPTVDLSSQPHFWFKHADWILPLEEPLRRD